MRLLLAAVISLMLYACGGYELKNLVKSDIDLVTDQFITKTREDVRELAVMLYSRNPSS